MRLCPIVPAGWGPSLPITCFSAAVADYAGLWGFLAFNFNFNPSIGSILAAVPPVLLAVLHGSPLYAGGVVLL